MNATTRIVSAVLFATNTLLFSSSADAAGWGTLKGRFVVDGDVGEPAPLNITKDIEYCSQHKPVDESIIVGEDGGLKNAVVFIRVGRRETLEVHPDYQKQLSEPVVLDNKGCAFDGHVTLVVTGQPLIIKNSDPFGHNTKADLQINAAFNDIIPAGEQLEKQFTKGERLPMPVGCNIHPWMRGHLLVREDPYMAASADDGSFEIANIPAGEHEFQFWQEKVGYLGDVEFNGGKTDRRGRVDITIEDGQTLDLGDMKIPAAELR